MAEMSEVMATFERYKEEAGRFLLQVQTVRVLDFDAFDRLEAHGQEIARRLKGHSSVPKSVLHEMRVAAKILRAEALYMSTEQRAMNDMADRLEMTFDLILLDEDHSDRPPGIPRSL
ncbi:hypothetical protein CO671_18080 [Rhizobium sp. M10]|uniref:hypothetical protein n=1 Tax=Rhizobium sp. M10 TaxID=1324586 RepID=UPI000BE9FCF7|nr:hypothetical protein [Rhizobium sp. M10]PDT35080.1 hypothetical protein CO671_18080 [Rhizobium sp. M10]